MRIYLIGMPGTGKTSVGGSLAQLMGYKFYDLDDEIQKKFKMTIPDIFIYHGEIGFREREKATLQALKVEDNCVVACGGGTVLDPTNKELMKDGKIIWIETDIEIIKNRLAIDPNVRPLLKRKALEELYEERKHIYEGYSNVRVTNNATPIDCAKKIYEVLKWRRILVVNGPNLNMLGKRNKDHYGEKTLDEINHEIKEYAPFEVEFFQSNCEGKIVTKLQEAYENFDAVIINPAAYTHSSVAIHDALEILSIPKVEVHLSDVNQREDFRKINYITDVCDKTISGMKEKGYLLAIDYLKEHFNML